MLRDFPRDLRYVLGLQESIVVALADGYAQARHKAALVITAGQQARSIMPYAPFLYSEQAAQALTQARRPVIVVGASVARNQAWDETLALAEHHNAAVWVAPMSARNGFPENHRLFAGFLPADRSGNIKALTGNDLVLELGAPAFTYHVEGHGAHVPRGAQLLQLTDDPAVAAWCPMGTSIVTDLKLGVAQLLALTTAAANSSTPLRTAPTIAARPLQRPA